MVVRMSWITAPCAAGDDADDRRQHRQRALALGVEQPLGGQALPQHLDPRQQRAGAGIVQPLDDELVFERSP